jgi:hypothetical protein
MSRLPIAILASAVLFASSSPAVAQPGTVPIEAPPDYKEAPAETEHSYRGWILGTSAASLGLYGLGALSEGEGGRDTGASDVFFAAGMGGFVLSGPIVHANQGNWSGALGSLALRLFVPSLTMFVAVTTADCDELLCELDRMGPGWVVGAAVATAMDAAWLAKRMKRKHDSPGVLPYAGAFRNGGLVGVSGSF